MKVIIYGIILCMDMPDQQTFELFSLLFAYAKSFPFEKMHSAFPRTFLWIASRIDFYEGSVRKIRPQFSLRYTELEKAIPK